ncbi:MAG: hypothetical protein HY043_19765 [Verrucomicrobia bacterium]|nr:hypothetical protein [Verrucomicrobiota bacterium]
MNTAEITVVRILRTVEYLVQIRAGSPAKRGRLKAKAVSDTVSVAQGDAVRWRGSEGSFIIFDNDSPFKGHQKNFAFNADGYVDAKVRDDAPLNTEYKYTVTVLPGSSASDRRPLADDPRIIISPATGIHR